MITWVVPALLLGYATLLALALPRLLPAASWVGRAPRLAIAVWHAAGITLVASIALALLSMAVPLHALSGGLASFLRACLDVAHSGLPGGLASRAVAAAALLALLGRTVTVSVTQVRRWRTEVVRQHDSLMLLSEPHAGARGVRVLRSDDVAAFCLPGNAGVIVTTGALRALRQDEFQAVVAHERAHWQQRHHLALLVAEVLAAVLPRVSMLRRAKEEIACLVELAADDHALLSQSRWALTDALLLMAERRPPSAALAAGGAGGLSGVARRVTRLLDDEPSLNPSTLTAGATALAAATTAPLLALLAPVLVLPIVACGVG